MTRRVTMLTLAAGMFLSAGCCWWRRCGGCGDGCSTSWGRGEVPCHLAGRGADPAYDPTFGVPAVGPVVPGPAAVPLPNELPYPQPSTNIPPAGVPLAPPSVAPDPGPGATGLRSGQPIRTGR